MYRTLIVLALVASGAPIAVAAQVVTRPDPANVTAVVPGVKYESALGGYRPFREETLADWRVLNEEVSRAGGHIGIMRGASGTGARDAKAAPGSGAHKH